jgi:hypothetical protein
VFLFVWGSFPQLNSILEPDSSSIPQTQSKPDRGIVRSFVEVLNQNREVVMSLKMVNFVRSRRSVEKE